MGDAAGVLEILTPCMKNARGDYSENVLVLERLRAYYAKDFPREYGDDLDFATFAAAYRYYKAPMGHPEEWLRHVRPAYDLFEKNKSMPDYVNRTYELLVARGMISAIR